MPRAPIAGTKSIPRATLSPEEILNRLESTGDSLTSGMRDAPNRHRSLRAAIEWSVDLLSAEEAATFAQLGVFAGGCNHETAEALCGRSDVAELLASLTDASLLVRRRTSEGRSRFSMLETIRECALEHLNGQAGEVHRSHAALFVELAEEAEREILGATQVRVLHLFDQELDNIRAAMRWSLEHDDPDSAGRIASAMTYYWWTRALHTEGRDRLARVREKRDDLSPRTAAKAAYGYGWLAWQQNDLDPAGDALEEAARRFHDLDDATQRARSLIALSWVRRDQGDPSVAERLLQEGIDIAHAVADDWTIGFSLDSLGHWSFRGGDTEQAISLWAGAVEAQRRVGERFGLSISMSNLAWGLLSVGEIDEAQRMFEEGLAIAREAGFDEVCSMGLAGLGFVELRAGHPAEAETYLVDGLLVLSQDKQSSGFKENIPDIMLGLAGSAAATGKDERSARLAGASKALRAATTEPTPDFGLWVDENLLAAARAALGGDRWDRVFNQGGKLPLDEIIALALEGS